MFVVKDNVMHIGLTRGDHWALVSEMFEEDNDVSSTTFFKELKSKMNNSYTITETDTLALKKKKKKRVKKGVAKKELPIIEQVSIVAAAFNNDKVHYDEVIDIKNEESINQNTEVK